jgi:folylpolyglutamate synthase/dihydropteroate synthase
LLDGAHNVDGASALAAAIDTLSSELRDVRGGVGTAPTLVLAAMADKDIARVCAALAASATLHTAHVICTSVGDPRSASPEQVASMARAANLGATVEVAATPEGALHAARQTSGPLIVAGSLYLVGSVRADLLRSGAIPDDGTLDHLSGSRA